MVFTADFDGSFDFTFHPGGEEHEDGHGELFESDTLERGGTFRFTFTSDLAGETVPYHNHMSHENEGSVTVGEGAEVQGTTNIDVLEDGNAPLLVTTADHPLLTPEVAAHFLSSCETVAADLVVGLVEREIVEDRFPTTARTWLHFRDGDYTGANLFGFRTRAARRAPAFWTRVENLRKRPWRMVSAFGPVALALFLARRLSLDAALERASQAIGARVGAVRLPYPEAAVDVDRASDLELAERILAERNRGPS